jgi:hypothetical protein
MIPRWALADMRDSRDLKAIADPVLSAEPIDSTEANEPIEPTDSSEPTEPIDSTEPFDAIDRTESSDHKDSRELCDAIVPACRTNDPHAALVDSATGRNPGGQPQAG